MTESLTSLARHEQETETPPLLERTVHDLKRVDHSVVFRIRNTPDELFLRLCANVLELPERAGKLPIPYSRLSVAELAGMVKQAAQSPTTSEVAPFNLTYFHKPGGLRNSSIGVGEVGGLTADGEYSPSEPDVEMNAEKQQLQLERERAQELLDMVRSRSPHEKIVRSVDDVLNPLGKIDRATLIFTADEHQPPSFALEGTRSYAFLRYAFQRIGEGILELIKQEKRWGTSPRRLATEQPDAPEDASKGSLQQKIIKIRQTIREYWHLAKQFAQKPEYGVEGKDEWPTPSAPAEVLIRRYIAWQEVRSVFMQWVTNVLASGAFRANPDSVARPILFNLGDLTNDGPMLIDALGANMQMYELAEFVRSENPKLDVGVLGINGNHDLDSRIPESAAMLAELVGHRIFVQDVGNVRIVALDTNIESPAWLEIFKQHANGDSAVLQALETKQKLQQRAIELMLESDKQVLLVAHHPARIVDALAIRKKVLQQSKVTTIISGHTHMEDHMITPIKNADGAKIALHVLDSTTKIDKNGTPLAPKLYTVDVDDTVGAVNTLQQPADPFLGSLRAIQHDSIV